jgi:DNA polymerase
VLFKMTETHLTIDFETRSEIDLKKVGAWIYSIHPSTEVLCMAEKVANYPTKLLTPDDFYIHKFNKSVGSPLAEYFTIEAHNAGFEFAIWHNIMVPRYGWPKIPLERWYCSAAKAASHGLPRKLEDAARVMGLSVQKDMTGHRVMMKMNKPRSKWKKTGEGPKWFEDKEDLRTLYNYCVNDVDTEYALSSALGPLSADERKVWILDQTINKRGISCDLDLIHAALEMIALLEGDAKDEIFDLTDGEVTSPSQVAKILEYIHTNFGYYDLSDLQADTVKQFLEEDDGLDCSLKRILELRQLHSKASTKKYQAMLNRSDDKGRIRETLMYWGAHTGRWAGMGIQPQNYIRPKFDRASVENLIIPAIKAGYTDELELYFGSPMDALASSLRATLCAEDGKVLIGADYSAIEARVLLWLVGDEEALDLYRSGACIYSDMAARIYGKPITEIENPSKERDMGKRAILGLGYQMGAPKFKKTCWDWAKVDVDLHFAKQVVKIYRNRYDKVVDFWYNVNDKSIETVKRKSSSLYHYDHESFRNKNLSFNYLSPFLHCHLPSGRKLSYKDPSLYIGKYDNLSLRYMGVNSVTRKWNRIDTYGGKLTENIVQAIARDIMAEGMLRAEAAGYPIVLTVHDEVIAETTPDKSVEEFVDLLTEVPEWAKGCPIDAEGWKGKRYRK